MVDAGWLDVSRAPIVDIGERNVVERKSCIWLGVIAES